jgi:hypothetical protein
MTLRRQRELGAEHEGRRRLSLPWALALTTTAVFLVALGALGGLGYAASAVSRLAKSTRAVADSAPAARAPAPHARAVAAARVVLQADTSASAQYGNSVTICHNGHTEIVSQSTLKAHLGRGDTAGRCLTGTFRPHKKAKVVAKQKPRNTG